MPRPVHIHCHTADAWNESQHPRADDGKFGAGNQVSAPYVVTQAMIDAKKSVVKEDDRQARVTAARDKAERLAGKDGTMTAQQVFGKGKWMDLDPTATKLYKPAEVRKNELIKTGTLHTTQEKTKLAGVVDYIDKKVDPKHLPEVIALKNGGHLILDGNHRAAAQVLKGFSVMRVNVVGVER